MALCGDVMWCGTAEIADKIYLTDGSDRIYWSSADGATRYIMYLCFIIIQELVTSAKAFIEPDNLLKLLFHLFVINVRIQNIPKSLWVQEQNY